MPDTQLIPNGGSSGPILLDYVIDFTSMPKTFSAEVHVTPEMASAANLDLTFLPGAVLFEGAALATMTFENNKLVAKSLSKLDAEGSSRVELQAVITSFTPA